MKKELEELCKREGFSLSMGITDGDHTYVMQKKKPLFINTIGEKFYNKEDKVYWFGKNNSSPCKNVLSRLKKANYSEGESSSQIYKTPESRDKALEEYKESLKPKYIKITRGSGWYSDLIGKIYTVKCFVSAVGGYNGGNAFEIKEREGGISVSDCAEVTEEEYKESLKPKYRAFKPEEVTEELMWKGIKRKDSTGQRLFGSVFLNGHELLRLFEQYTFFDGSPVGKLI